MTTLVELYRHVGERLRMDVSKKDINTAKYDIANVTTQHNNHHNSVICIAPFTDLSRTLTRTRDVCCAKYFSFEAVRPAIQKLHCTETRSTVGTRNYLNAIRYISLIYMIDISDNSISHG